MMDQKKVTANPDPLAFIAHYNKTKAIPFNDKLFQRDDNEIIECLKNVILSCQRDCFFTIHVDSFEVVKDPLDVDRILYEYEQAKVDRSKQPRDNPYDYIQTKNSKVNLLIINYTIGIGEKYSKLRVLIMVPKYVNKYMFFLQGNEYIPMFQVVDGSTYNSATTSAKYDSVVSRPIFSPTRVYKFFDTIVDTQGEDHKVVIYTCIYNKPILVFKYLLAKYGLMGTMAETGIYLNISQTMPDEDENYYIFEKNGVYINTPKILFDNDNMVQSFVHCVLRGIGKDTTYNDLFEINHWICTLDGDNNPITEYNIQKGLRMLDSLENIYDIQTMNSIHLPMEDKCNIYRILIWMSRNFSNLMNKSNLDVSMKRVRQAEYIAALYAVKMATGIYRIASSGKRAKVETIRKAIDIPPNFLITQITKCSLVNFNNLVNDDDAIASIKYSFKGIAGIGEKSGSSVSDAQKNVDKSHMGIFDTCSSTPSSPGMSGTLVPFCHIGEHGYFSDYQEPNDWDQRFAELMDTFHKTIGLKEVAIFERNVLGKKDKDIDIEIAEQAEECIRNLIMPVKFVEETSTELKRAVFFV